MKTEIWKPVVGYEGLYEISRFGQIRSVPRMITQKNRWGGITTRYLKGEIMKPKISKNGYLAICLHKGGKSETLLVHRIVAMAFIPNHENKPQIDHINGIKTDNRVENLRWVTAAENAANPLWVEKANNKSETTRSKMSKSAYKSHNKPIEQYDMDGNLIGVFESSAIACRFYGFDKSHICAVLKGRRKQSYGYIWKFKE